MLVAVHQGCNPVWARALQLGHPADHAGLTPLLGRAATVTRVLRLAIGLVVLGTLAVGASSANATSVRSRSFAARLGSDAQVSSNWAGYAVTGTNPDGTPVTYTDVTGSWVQPTVTCTGGSESYSAFWVGLGGFSSDSQALEQIGTESNCDSRGRAVYDAWYEIVPAPSIPIKLKSLPGDRITAAVLVQGTQVTLQLTNATRRTRVTKRVTVAAPDLTSAEWISKAPSSCTSSGRCTTLPLANFGSVAFARSAATNGAPLRHDHRPRLEHHLDRALRASGSAPAPASSASLRRTPVRRRAISPPTGTPSASPGSPRRRGSHGLRVAPRCRQNIPTGLMPYG